MSQKLIRCFIAVLVSVGTALAQINYSLQTGSPTFSVNSPVEMGFVNLANGNLHLEIPLGSFPERGGHTLTAKMVYDSRIWSVINYGTGAFWNPGNVPNSWSGWRFVTSADAGAVLPATVMTNCGGSNYYDTYSAFTWTAPDGTQHVFPITTLQEFGCTVTPVSTGSAMAEDSAGYYMSVTNYTQATIYGPDGAIVHDDTQSVYSVKDPNGNYFSHDGSGNIVDTLGRTVVKESAYRASTYYDVLNSEGTTSRFTVTTGQTDVGTDFGDPGVRETQGPITTVSSIQLPDGGTYYFTYDSGYGLLQSMQLASGGTINYTWATFSGPYFGSYLDWNRYLNTRVSGGGTTTYAYANSSSCGVTGDLCFTATLTNPSNTATVYTFAINNGAWNIETTGTVVGTVLDTYDFSNTLSGAGTVYIRKTTEDIATQMSNPSVTLNRQTEYSYDSPQNGNITALKEWSYYTGTPNSTPDRETDFTYQTASGYTNKHIINLVTDKSVKNLAGTKLAETKTTYDGSTPISVTGVFNHDDTNYGTGDTTRGNPTSIQQWVSGSTYLSSTFTYDTTGQVTSAADPDNHVTTYSHADNFFTDSSGYTNPPTGYTPSTPTNAYLTSVTLPVSGTKTYGYYFGDGKQALSKDQNGQTTYSHYEPVMDCVANTSYPDGGYANNTYGVGSECSAVSANNGGFTVSLSIDEMSRPSSAANGPMSAGVTYDPSSQVQTSTNPYESTNDPTYGVTNYSYDGWGRVLSTVYADNNQTDVVYGNGYAYGNGELCSTATYGYGYPTWTLDQSNNAHQSWADGFGRTIEVDEPGSNGYLTIGTCYQYDALGNLTEVVQGSQTRTYQYDGLSRMISETTPEAGTTDYYYTLTGGAPCAGATDAICRRTDSGGILTSYAYDAENRLTSKTYSDGTATAKYYYDQASVTVSGTQYTLLNTKGRLSQTAVGTQGETIHSYDPMGRTQDLWECTSYNCSNSPGPWNIHYTYDLAGDLLTWSHPAGFTISTNYTSMQQVYTVSSSLYDSTHPETLMAFTYGGSGQPIYIDNGCPPQNCAPGFNYLVSTWDYNNRLQPVRIQVGPINNVDYSCVVYNYYADVANPTTCAVPNQSGSWDNGTLIGEYVQDTANPSLGHTTSYTYDNLSRLLTSVATPGQTGGAAHNLAFSYDQYGNMTCVQGGSTNGPCPQLTFTATTNQLSTSGFTYNVQGDLTGDGTHTYQWDAEGRLKSVDSGTTATYTYNALGWRVEKKVGSAYTEYLFGASGDRLGENNRTTWTESYVPLGYGQYAIYQGNATYFTHPNALGSTTMVTDYDGNVVQDKLFYPWGQDWQTVGSIYDERFAKLQRRDTETSLDPTANRMFASLEGRWLTPDPAAGDVTDPQTFNRYAYALNNPCTMTDPLGLSPCPYKRGKTGTGPSLGDEFDLLFHPYSDDAGSGLTLDPNTNNLSLLGLLQPPGEGSACGGTGKLPSCSSLSLSNTALFNDPSYANAAEVESFFALDTRSPNWNVGLAAADFAAAGLNPGLAVGILGAETSLGNGGPLSQANIANPFDCFPKSLPTNFAQSTACALTVIGKLEGAATTTNLLAALEGQNTLGQSYADPNNAALQQKWIQNVNGYFRKFAKFLGKCK